MKIALFRDTIYGHTHVREDRKYASDTEVRISEFVEVQFTMIPEAQAAAGVAEAHRLQAKEVLEAYKAKQQPAVGAESTVGLTKN
jgi:hypothetical protein